MTVKDCPHGGHPLACLDCLEEGNVPARQDVPGAVDPAFSNELDADAVVVCRPFHAKYESSCPVCGDDVRIGDLIVKVSSAGDERYIHHHPCSEGLEYEER